jgi:hypothetical protein
MAHHKRKRPKNRRAGCLLCKPWKMNGFAKGRVDAESLSDHRRRFDAEGQLKEARVEMFHTRHSVVNFKYNIPPEERRIQQLVAQSL